MGPKWFQDLENSSTVAANSPPNEIGPGSFSIECTKKISVICPNILFHTRQNAVYPLETK